MNITKMYLLLLFYVVIHSSVVYCQKNATQEAVVEQEAILIIKDFCMEFEIIEKHFDS
jgi:hypothetical protein